jgi:hypothetical protein
LYSLGADGLTGHSGGTDDVVRGGNGAFVGLISDYLSIPGATNGQWAATSGDAPEGAGTIGEKDVLFTK